MIHCVSRAGLNVLSLIEENFCRDVSLNLFKLNILFEHV